MFRNSSIISPQQKVLNASNRGSQPISSPLAFAEGLYFFKLFFKKRRIFNKLYSIYKIETKRNLISLFFI
ncbi:hypothetical protein CVT91_11665 [Candidatus Atribacteria bacterium HGW-Atribacteria-1]|nr:MAG: hypothetical protein CVT91_11665 [Candidatus Atribacteria bacterium HGW-Atribacteria-1]